MQSTYEEFLRQKVNFDSSCGFEIDPSEINPILKPHQRAIVQWAVSGGRRAIFAAFGLGKSVMQLETLRLVLERTGGTGLIVCPLGVRQEFARDARMLGLTTTFIRRTEEMTCPGLYLTNYESIRDDRLDPTIFEVVSLDEASVLRSYGSKTFQSFLTLFKDVKFRFVATATPSPNRHKELIHYAGFLGIMDTGQCLTRFFQRDSTQASNLTLYPHKEREFWLWLNTWACFIQKPSDLGYDDTGYDLPEIEVVYHQVESDHDFEAYDRDGQALAFNAGGLGVSDASKEKRRTMDARVGKAAELVSESPEDHFVLWHDLEDERRAIKKAIPEAVEIYGSLDIDIREERIINFSEGKIRILATKPELSGSGCNFQRHCHRLVFVGVNFKFNDFIQAIHRAHRFLQEHKVREVGMPSLFDLLAVEQEQEEVPA